MIKNKFFSYFFSFAILFSLFGFLNSGKLNQNDYFTEKPKTENLINITADQNVYTAQINEIGRTNIKFTVLYIPDDFFPTDINGDVTFAFSTDQNAYPNPSFTDNANITLDQVIDNENDTYNLVFNASSLDSSTKYEIYSIFGWYEDSNNPGIWIPFSDGDGNNEIQLLNENGESGISATTKMSSGYFWGIIAFSIVILILLITIVVIFFIRYNTYRKTKEKYDLLNKEIK